MDGISGPIYFAFSFFITYGSSYTCFSSIFVFYLSFTVWLQSKSSGGSIVLITFFSIFSFSESILTKNLFSKIDDGLYRIVLDSDLTPKDFLAGELFLRLLNVLDYLLNFYESVTNLGLTSLWMLIVTGNILFFSVICFNAYYNLTLRMFPSLSLGLGRYGVFCERRGLGIV